MAFLIIILFSAVLLYLNDPPEQRYIGSLENIENQLPAETTVLEVPYVRQKWMYCSEAATAMVLQYYDHADMTQVKVNRGISHKFETMLPPLENYLENCSYASLNFDSLKKEIDENDPVMIRILSGAARHTLVVVGYGDNFFILHDPGKGPYLIKDTEILENEWMEDENGHLSIIVD